MILAIIISLITFALMIVGILFFPKIKLGKIKLDSYWVIALLGLIVLLIFGLGDLKTIFNSLTENSAINPLKILTLFISMTALSIFLDEAGFFKYIAYVTLKKAKTNQKKLFFYLYLIVSILTVFTSNDIIILSFTPFICYFCKEAKINPIPYLAGEFVAANTWSMALIIGNPTNIYICSAFSINFIEYLKVMILPTLLSGIVAFLLLYLIFRKKLNAPLIISNNEVKITDKASLVIGLICLGGCTVLLAVLSYFNVEMWKISAGAFLLLILSSLIVSIIKKEKPVALKNSILRAPWQLVPFILSMFSIIIILKNLGITEKISTILTGKGELYKYGVASFLSSNLINNIPMSVLFCAILDSTATLSTIYATVIGSNLGAIFTPIGALAGIMWTSLLSSHDLKYGYFDFLKIGILVGIPSLTVALSTLSLVL